MTTLILRHRRENLKKCSLRGLENDPQLQFYTYPIDPLPSLEDVLVLKVGAPPLSAADEGKTILLIDGTWKLAKVMEQSLTPPFETRSLPPGYRTAYPRKQTDCPDPQAGLASIEALYIAHRLLKKPHEHLLRFYHWRELFFALNN